MIYHKRFVIGTVGSVTPIKCVQMDYLQSIKSVFRNRIIWYESGSSILGWIPIRIQSGSETLNKANKKLYKPGERMVDRQRLRLHDVEAGGGDLTAGQGRHQILLVHDPSCTVQRTVTLPPPKWLRSTASSISWHTNQSNQNQNQNHLFPSTDTIHTSYLFNDKNS